MPDLTVRHIGKAVLRMGATPMFPKIHQTNTTKGEQTNG
nr:MAG TPA: hypothetical protein [Caudoviricetes sp.]